MARGPASQLAEYFSVFLVAAISATVPASVAAVNVGSS